VALQHLSGGRLGYGGRRCRSARWLCHRTERAKSNPGSGVWGGGLLPGRSPLCMGRGGASRRRPTLIQPSRVRPPAFRRDSGGKRVALQHPVLPGRSPQCLGKGGQWHGDNTSRVAVSAALGHARSGVMVNADATLHAAAARSAARGAGRSNTRAGAVATPAGRRCRSARQTAPVLSR
jgi:hypothetical protein